MGGKVTVESIFGKGTSFDIILQVKAKDTLYFNYDLDDFKEDKSKIEYLQTVNAFKYT